MTTETARVIALPTATRARLEGLLTQREALNAIIEATVETVREALNVPNDYQLRNVRDGFVRAENAQSAEGTE